MATTPTTETAATQTATATPLKLTPPDPVPVVAADNAAGLVPVSSDAERYDVEATSVKLIHAMSGLDQPKNVIPMPTAQAPANGGHVSQ